MFRAKDEGRVDRIDLVGIGAICGEPEPERADDAGEDKSR
jgi:hypothetical protein